MDAAIIERWIKSIGRSYDVLIAEGVIPNQPLTELYKGRDWLTLKPGGGLELSFWTETKSLETFHIVLLKTMEGMTEYKGELPKPFAEVMFQSGVRATFGQPMESQGPTKLPLNTMIGGWDAYRLDPAAYPNTKLIFIYAETMQVKTLTFTLIDKDHD